MSSSKASLWLSPFSPSRRSWSRCSRTPAASSLFSLSYSLRLVLFHVLALQIVRAADVYVDDNDGSISYAPGDSWAQGNGCGSCALSPSSGSAHDGTWHDTTYYPNGGARTITFRFTGTGISAYFIVPDRAQGTASVDTSLSFTLDGSQAGTYTHSSSGSTDFLYNQRVFSSSGLSNGDHTLVVSAGATSDGGSTAVLFDYLVYTTQDEPSTTAAAPASSSTQNTTPPSSQAAAASSSSENSGSSSSLNDASPSTQDSSRTGTATGDSLSSTGTISSLAVSGTVSPISGSSGLVSVTSVKSASPSQSGSSDNNSTTLSDSDPDSGSSSSNVGAIVGGVVGGILGLIALLALLLCWRKRQRKAIGSTYGDEAPISPTVVPEANSGWARMLSCWSDSSSSNLTPHPVVFIDRTAPSSPGQKTENRSFGNSPTSFGLEAARMYGEKGRPLIRRDIVSEVTEDNDRPESPTTSTPTNTQMSGTQAGGGTNELSPETTAILSQVAALQAVVMSLQEQRAREGDRVVDPMDIGVAPPEYSRA
ncbi:hypothetical protein ACEPAI_3597 [Sanghuangporus weigelae]